MTTWLADRERWLPGAAGLVWWMIFHPGFIGEDSLIHLVEARDGVIGVWFTAWWEYIVRALTVGTRVVSLLTLVSVLLIEYAVYLWMTTVFPHRIGREQDDRRARALAVLLMSATPLVPGIGIQIRHDVPMAAGLLLCAVALTRASAQRRFAGPDYALLALAAPLVATRHNGTPTLLAAAVLLLLVTAGRQWRSAVGLAAVAAAAAGITYGATRTSGNSSSVDPFQTVEWLMGDISCALSRGVEPTAEEWATLTRIADRTDWPHPHACLGMNPLHTTRTFKAPRSAGDVRALVDTWMSLVLREPLPMIVAHATRVRLFLPPFVTGMPPSLLANFMHSTIMPNDFGLAWTFPAIAEPARNAVRLWNALAFVIANAAVWLIALLIVAWKRPDERALLLPTIVIASALLIGLLAAAPQSEGRYGFFILICGQSATLVALLRKRHYA